MARISTARTPTRFSTYSAQPHSSDSESAQSSPDTDRDDFLPQTSDYTVLQQRTPTSPLAPPSMDSASEPEVQRTPTRRRRDHLTARPHRSPLRHRRHDSPYSTPLIRSSAQSNASKLRHASVSSTASTSATESDTAPAAAPISEADTDTASYPLVLLHVTVLPLPAIFTIAAAVDALSDGARERLLKLRARMDGEVERRGVLVPHPRGDLGLLEERVLQGLGLEEGRVGEDGHFRFRPEEMMSGEGEERVDSGTEMEDVAGSGLVNGPKEGGKCETCQSRVVEDGEGVGGEKRWDVKIFAANGLMRAATWAMAWREMERVDVSVTPWIDEAIRGRLDAIVGEEEKMKTLAQEEQETEKKSDLNFSTREEEQTEILRFLRETYEGTRSNIETDARIEKLEAQIEALKKRHTMDQETQPTYDLRDLPPAFKPEQVPLEVLVRNYLYLLAKDTRNILIAGLLVLTVVLSFQLSLSDQARLTMETDSCAVLGQTIAESLASLGPRIDRQDSHLADETGASWESTTLEAKEIHVDSAVPAEDTSPAAMVAADLFRKDDSTVEFVDIVHAEM